MQSEHLGVSADDRDGWSDTGRIACDPSRTGAVAKAARRSARNFSGGRAEVTYAFSRQPSRVARRPVGPSQADQQESVLAATPAGAALTSVLGLTGSSGERLEVTADRQEPLARLAVRLCATVLGLGFVAERFVEGGRHSGSRRRRICSIASTALLTRARRRQADRTPCLDDNSAIPALASRTRLHRSR